ncbi:hypothetical protein KEM55_005791 [Ascosphaera atra]|nr:hypothetical protein KEM55_005791 [Ascosphaera atra]
MSTSPRRRDNDRPVSPIKSEASSPPRVDLLTSPPRSSHSNLQPQPQYQHEHSPSASPAPRHLRNQSSQSNVRMVPPRQPSGGMSRSNTTARPRPQPSQDTLVSRSMSMRAGSNQRPFEKGSPSLSNGWQKPQYMPAPSPAPSSISAPRQRPRVPEVAEPPEGERTNDYHKSSSSVSSSQNGTNSLKPFPLSRDVSKDSVPRAVDHSPPSSSSSTLPSYQDSSVSVLTEKTIPPSQPAEQEQHHSPPTPPQPQTQKPVSQPQSQSAAPKKNWRALTSAVTQNALSDFTLTAKQYYDIFEASAQDVSSHLSGVEEKGLTEWIRTSVWWVLKGRSQLEAAIRNPTAAPVFQKQGAVNLAKAWWINNEVVPTHAELSRLKQQISNAHGDDGGDGLRVGTEVMLGLARNLGDARMSSLITLHQTVSSHIRALATSMKRNNINLVPPVDLQEGELDTSIWLHYPYFGADVTALLSTLVPRTLRVDQRNKASDIDIGELMPFADTSRFFNYGRMFVTAVVQSDDDDDEDIADARNQEMRCVLSLARERSEWHIQAFIASQNNLVNLVIQSDKRQGPTWHDVRFDSRHLSMKVRLSRGWKLEIRFTGMDGKAEFERLWKMVEHTRKVEAGLNAEEHETVAFESVLKAFQYVGSPGAAGAPFPTEPTQRCRIRLFEKQVPMPEANGTRFAHMGYRMICVTSPKVKNLSSLSHSFTHSSPIIFAHARSKDDGEDSPILLLKLNNKSTGAPFQVRLTFHESGELSRFHALLLSVALHRSEEKTPDIPMRSFSIEDPTMATRSNATFIPGLVSFPGQVNGPAVKAGVTVSVINTTPDLMEHGRSRTVGSNNLRLFVKCGWGSVTDRMNLGKLTVQGMCVFKDANCDSGPGEMKLNLDPQAMTTMSLYRGGQHDLTVSYADNLAPTESRETISRFLKAAGSTPTIRKFHFNSVRELHEFEHALTGFNVLFDGLASVLTISRRRMVVPIYKKWEALGVRLQIVQQEKAIQLLAFFSDFAHGKCMNFAIKGTDVFETVSRSGKYGVRIVDAKFPLPKRAGQPVGEDSTLRTGEEEYLCLDLPDFPSEHDDIMIWFDDEQVWKEFQTAVPGIIREASKIGSLRH